MDTDCEHTHQFNSRIPDLLINLYGCGRSLTWSCGEEEEAVRKERCWSGGGRRRKVGRRRRQDEGRSCSNCPLTPEHLRRDKLSTHNN